MNSRAHADPPPTARILVVDDEVANIAALKTTLTARGYAVEGVADAVAALQALDQSRYDLLLADLNMPSVSGLELLKTARARDPDLMTVIMTGAGTVAAAVEAMKSGAVDFVLKPLKLGTLLPVIERALTLRRLRIDNTALEAGLRARTEELEDALREVEHQVGERLKAEQALMQAQKMEAIGRLTGGVAHDFNNLLAAVIGNLELLQRKIEPQAPFRRFVDNALEAANRGARVTGQLLAFSRTQRLSRQPVPVDETLARSEPLLRHGLGPDVRLAIELGATDLWSNTDPTQLELAALNLIVNARDALPRGGDIRLRTGVEGDRVFVEVQDNGSGMTAEVLERAAEPFFTTKNGAGSGLGLAQVYGFARQCGGDCEIDSAPGLGTRVRILLPRIAPPAREAAPKAIEPAPADAPYPLTVLLIDDDEQVRSTFADGLESEGFTVVAAPDGPSGLRLLDESHPDVAILDYAMPAMNGAEVARKAQAKYPHLPIIFCSGYADSLVLDQIDDAIVLRKPISIGDLCRAVRDVAA